MATDVAQLAVCATREDFSAVAVKELERVVAVRIRGPNHDL